MGMTKEQIAEMSSEILALKKSMNAVILAHYYEEPEIQDLGDFVGDSLGLCIEASKTDADVILFCGVHFMAESAKLLNPDKTVLIPDQSAGCPMADMADVSDLKTLKEKHPDASVVTYVNSTAAVKGESDICCTSSNAVKIVTSIPKEKEILFVPDQNLGQYVEMKTGRKMVLWEGFCPVHHLFVTLQDIHEKRREYPYAKVLVHPECPPSVLKTADFVGSTAQILQYCREATERGEGRTRYIIGTEKGILYPLQKQNPDALFVPASDKMTCKNMKKITLEKVLTSLREKRFEVTIPEDLRDRALRPIQKMLKRSG